MPLIMASELPYPRPRPNPERDTNPSSKRLTYNELEQREPRLTELHRRIVATRPGPDFCANATWFRPGGYKAQLLAIIGNISDNEDAALRTASAYDVAYQTLYRRLPDCRHESICGSYR